MTTAGRITLPTGREPTDDEVTEVQDFLADEDWFSDYDCGISLNINSEMRRVGPGQTIVRDDSGVLSIEGEETPYYD